MTAVDPRVVTLRGSPILNLPEAPLTGLAINLDDAKLGLPAQYNILIAPELSVEVALSAIDLRSAAILTSSGSFAAHGANLLRAARELSGLTIIWVTNLPSLFRTGAALTINPNGEVTALHTDISAISPPELPVEIVQMTVDDPSRNNRCYWPHRTYDVFTASLMVPGLSSSARALSNRNVDVWRNDAGYIWFGPHAPELQKIVAVATDPTKAQSLLRAQIAFYHRAQDLVASMRFRAEPRTFSDLALLAEAVTEYFSHLLLLHNTYEQVLRFLSHLGLFSSSALEQAREDLFQCDLNRWIVGTRLHLPIKKDLFEPGPPIPLPPFSLSEDISEQLRRCSRLCSQVNTPVNRELLDHIATVFAVKEWKFFINKLLFREFSVTLRSLVSGATVNRDLPFATAVEGFK
jgi:hypothetical protein